MEISQSKSVKPKMRGYKLRRVNWQRALNKKCVKQGLGVLSFLEISHVK
jgi:hypothetical protein